MDFGDPTETLKHVAFRIKSLSFKLMNFILQLVPPLTSPVCGLRDHATRLAECWSKQYGVESCLLTLTSSPLQPHTSLIPVKYIPATTASHIANELKEIQSSQKGGSLFLHYVSHGYEKRGCPFKLVRALKTWKRQNPGAKFVTFFHELTAFSSPLHSAFWTYPFQRYLIKQIIDLSDDILTNRAQYGAMIHRMSRSDSRRIKILPVFSNVGEIENPKPLHLRFPRLVIFGTRKNIFYTQYRSAITEICKCLNIREVVDIGPAGSAEKAPFGSDLLFQALGVLPHPKISQILADSRIGLVNHRSDALGKSGIFAACAAHQLGIIIPEFYGDQDGLAVGQHYVTLQNRRWNVNQEKWQYLAVSAHQWYFEHSIDIQGAEIMRVITGEEDCGI